MSHFPAFFEFPPGSTLYLPDYFLLVVAVLLMPETTIPQLHGKDKIRNGPFCHGKW